MATQEKLIEIKVEYTKAVNALIETKNEITKLKLQNAEWGKDMEANGGKILANNAQIKNLTATLNQNTKAVQAEILQVKGSEGAYQKLNLQYQLSAQKAKDLAAQYGVHSASAKSAAAEANNLNNKLKDIDKSVGQNQRSVGDYGLATAKLPGIFGEMQTSALTAYDAIGQKLTGVKQLMADYISAKEAEKIAQEASTIASAAAAEAEALAVASKEAAIIASDLAAKKEIELAAAEEAEVLASAQAAAAEAARAAAIVAATVATEASSAAMRIFKIALISTGLGAFVVVLGSLVAYFMSTNDGAKMFSRIMTGVNAVVQEGIKIVGSFGRVIADLLTGNTKALAKDWEEVKKNVSEAGENTVKNYKEAMYWKEQEQKLNVENRQWEIDKLKRQKEMEVLALRIRDQDLTPQQRKAAAEETKKIMDEIYNHQKLIEDRRLKIMEQLEAFESKKDPQKIADQKKVLAQLEGDRDVYLQSIMNKEAKVNKQLAKDDKLLSTQLKKESDDRIKSAEQTANDEIKILEKKLSIELKAIQDDLNLNELVQDEKLAGKIKTDAEWLKIDNDRIIKERNSKLFELSNEKDTSLDAIKILNEEKTKLQAEQQKKETEETKRKIETINNQIQVENDKLKEGEDKKLVIIQEAKTKIAQNNAAADAKIKADELQSTAMALDNEFELAKGNIDRELQLTYDKIEDQRIAEIAAANGNAKLIKALNDKYHLADVAASNDAAQKKIANVEKYATAAESILSNANNFAKSLGDRELSNWAKMNNGKAGFDAEYAKKKAKIDHDAAVRGKALALISAILSTAQAVIGALAPPPTGAGPILGIPLAILAGAAGALQVGTILATPIPDESSAGTSSKQYTTVTSQFHTGKETGEIYANDQLKSDEIYSKLLKVETVLDPRSSSIFDNIIRNVSLQGGSAQITSNIGTNQIDQSLMIEAAMTRAFSKMPPTQLSLVEWKNFMARDLLLLENRQIK